MALGVVQAVETRTEVGEKTRQILPRRRWLELTGHDEVAVVAELRVALIAEQPPRGGLQRYQVLVIGSVGEQRLTVSERRARLTHAEPGGSAQRSGGGVGGHHTERALGKANR